MSQLAFDLELETPEPLYYDTMPNTKTGCCRDCRKPVKGHYNHHQGGVNQNGWYMICDRCIAAKHAAAVAAAPTYPCGLHKVRFEWHDHIEECLDCVCPWCGEQELNSFLLDLNHTPDAFISERDQICMKQRSARMRGAA